MLVCVDDVGCRRGRPGVLLPTEVAARQSDTSSKVASDYTIYGIVDSINMRCTRTYDKAKEAEACSWRK